MLPMGDQPQDPYVQQAQRSTKQNSSPRAEGQLVVARHTGRETMEYDSGVEQRNLRGGGGRTMVKHPRYDVERGRRICLYRQNVNAVPSIR
jgi:hypothetical protein